MEAQVEAGAREATVVEDAEEAEAVEVTVLVVNGGVAAARLLCAVAKGRVEQRLARVVPLPPEAAQAAREQRRVQKRKRAVRRAERGAARVQRGARVGPRARLDLLAEVVVVAAENGKCAVLGAS